MTKTYELKPKKVKAYQVKSLDAKPKWTIRCDICNSKYGVETYEGYRCVNIGSWVVSLGKGYYEVLSDDEFKRKYGQVK